MAFEDIFILINAVIIAGILVYILIVFLRLRKLKKYLAGRQTALEVQLQGVFDDLNELSSMIKEKEIGAGLNDLSRAQMLFLNAESLQDKVLADFSFRSGMMKIIKHLKGSVKNAEIISFIDEIEKREMSTDLRRNLYNNIAEQINDNIKHFPGSFLKSPLHMEEVRLLR